MLLAGLFIATTPRNWNPLYRPYVKGYLMVETRIGSQVTWSNADTLDTFVVAGIDTNWKVMITPVTKIEGLSYTISANGDSVFVESDSAQTTSDKYNYFIFY